MPLQIHQGTPLNPQNPVSPPIELDFNDVVGGAPRALAQPVVLKIKQEFQQGREWCWAACIQMVLEYYNPNQKKSQCEIVGIKLHDPNHQCSDNPDLNLDDCEAVDMEQAWRDCGIEKVVPEDTRPTFDAIKAELRSGRPIEVGILWSEGGGHAVLIKGWSAAPPESLVINDPLRASPLLPNATDGSGRITYDELVDAFGHGNWRYTWLNLV